MPQAQKQIQKEKKKGMPAETVLKIVQTVLAVITLTVLAAALLNVKNSSALSGTERLEESVRRTVVACYATEGMYPESVEYLKEHYGLQIDDDRYFVGYRLFADNLMPDITVTERKK